MTLTNKILGILLLISLAFNGYEIYINRPVTPNGTVELHEDRYEILAKEKAESDEKVKKLKDKISADSLARITEANKTQIIPIKYIHEKNHILLLDADSVIIDISKRLHPSPHQDSF